MTSLPGVLGLTTARGLFRRLITLSPISRYAVAVVAAVVAVGVRLNFDPMWGVRLPFIPMFPAAFFEERITVTIEVPTAQ